MIETLLLAAGGYAAWRYLKSRSRAATDKVYVRNGVIYGPQRFSYRLSDNDVTWLARAVIGEVAENESAWNNATTVRGGQAVIWALVQNHAKLVGTGGKRPRYSTFAGLVRAYCQPVNPIWMDPQGEKCRRNPAACTASKLARRQRISSRSWDSIPLKVRQLIGQLYNGTLPNPVPGLTDWAASDWPGWSINIGGNRFGVVRGRTMV